MEEQYFIIKIYVFRKSPINMWTLPGVLKIGVTVYRFLQYKSARGRRERVEKGFIALSYASSARPQTVFVSTNMENLEREIREDES